MQPDPVAGGIRMHWRLALSAIIPVLLGSCAILPGGGNANEASPVQGPAASAPAPASGPAPRPIERATPTAPAVTAANPNATTAAAAGVFPGPAISTLNLKPDEASRALAAFKRSCPAVQKRNDLSGLATGTDWKAPCDAAANWPSSDAVRFFSSQFTAVQVGEGKAFVTGYYDPQIPGSRTRSAAYPVPIYGVPKDLVEIDLGDFSKALAGKTIRGRMENGQLIPYHDRTAIDNGALNGKAPILAWAADYVDVFVMQIQGSGTLKLPDGGTMRIAYASQNGQDYTGIGRVLRERGELEPGKATMPDIVRYLKADRSRGTDVMRVNASYVFFRESSGPPVGAMNIPVFRQASAAADPMFVPLGAPVWLSLDRAEPNGLWIVQDTGGAIKGANRFDSFWGAGAEGEAIAGGMSARGSALILLPKTAAARLLAPKTP
jgi:membrane-bound lytic murein transglycosylase A